MGGWTETLQRSIFLRKKGIGNYLIAVGNDGTTLNGGPNRKDLSGKGVTLEDTIFEPGGRSNEPSGKALRSCYVLHSDFNCASY